MFQSQTDHQHSRLCLEKLIAAHSGSGRLLGAPLGAGSVSACSASQQSAYPPSAGPDRAGPPPPQNTDLRERGGGGKRDKDGEKRRVEKQGEGG